MVSEWVEVETLIRELGVARARFDQARVADAVKAEIESAIAEAAQIVLETLNAPQDGEAIQRARQAVATTRERIAGLASEMERSRRASRRAAELGLRRKRRTGSR